MKKFTLLLTLSVVCLISFSQDSTINEKRDKNYLTLRARLNPLHKKADSLVQIYRKVSLKADSAEISYIKTQANHNKDTVKYKALYKKYYASSQLIRTQANKEHSIYCARIKEFNKRYHVIEFVDDRLLIP